MRSAAWRRAALIEIYKNQNKAKQIDDSRNSSKTTAQSIIAKYPQSDWAYRARTLIYLVDQKIPTFGNAIE
jgi:hypothetical protein